MELTGTPEDVKEKIADRMKQDLAGGSSVVI